MSGDIDKMFRCVRIIPEHCKYQHILYRFSETEPVNEFELLTNSYRLTSAPFIAMRAIEQLCVHEKSSFPEIPQIIPRDV